MDMAGAYALHWSCTGLALVLHGSYICLVRSDWTVLSQSIVVFQLVLSVFNMGFEKASGNQWKLRRRSTLRDKTIPSN